MVHFVNLIPALATLKRRERGSPSLFVACYWVDQRRDHGDDTFSKSFPLSPQVAPRCPGKSLLHSVSLLWEGCPFPHSLPTHFEVSNWPVSRETALASPLLLVGGDDTFQKLLPNVPSSYS